MGDDLIARASVDVGAPSAKVWDALVSPEAIRQYMFGTQVVTDWREGSPITWKGEWQGRSYEDRGVILRLEPGRMLRYSHYSPRSGLPDEPGNHHTVTIELTANGARTHVSLAQDKNPTEQARAHSEKTWAAMLAGLKALVERQEAGRPV